MKIPWYAWTATVGICALILEGYAYAGLQRTPVVGPAVAAQARMQAPLTHTYLVTGGYLLRVTPFMEDASAAIARATWGDAYAAISRHPEQALYQLGARPRGVVHGLLSPLRWFPPLLLPLALFGWLLRPRAIRSLRGTR